MAADQSDGPGSDVFLPPTKPQRATDTAGDNNPLGHVGLRLALKLLDDGDPAAATIAAYALPDRIDTKIVDWLIAISGDKNVTSTRIAEISAKLADWPGQSLLRLRFEQALMRENPGPQPIIKAFAGSKPETDDGAVLLARAYLAVGRKADAAALSGRCGATKTSPTTSRRRSARSSAASSPRPTRERA